MCVRPQRDAERTRETKVGQLEVAVAVDEQVLRFEVTVKDAMRVEVIDALDELPREPFDDVWPETV